MPREIRCYRQLQALDATVMGDDAHGEHKPMEGSSDSQEQPAQTNSTQTSTTSVETAPENRTLLLEQARTFLTSPNVVNEAPEAKRKFLVEKGLHDEEINNLLRDAVSQALFYEEEARTEPIFQAASPACHPTPNVPSTASFQPPVPPTRPHEGLLLADGMLRSPYFHLLRTSPSSQFVQPI